MECLACLDFGQATPIEGKGITESARWVVGDRTRWEAIHLSMGNPTHLNGTSGSVPTFSSSTVHPAFDFNEFVTATLHYLFLAAGRVFVDLCVTIMEEDHPWVEPGC